MPAAAEMRPRTVLSGDMVYMTVLLVALCHVFGHLVSLVLDFLDVTNHVEGHLWQVIVLALHDALETLDSVCDLHILACITSNHVVTASMGLKGATTLLTSIEIEDPGSKCRRQL